MRCILLSVLCASAVGLFACRPNPGESQRATQGTDADLRAEFETRYAAWRGKFGTLDYASSLGAEVGARQLRLPEFDRLVDLGPQALPFFVEEIDAKGDSEVQARYLNRAVERITKMKPNWRQGAVEWWRSRPNTPTEFAKAYTRWKELKAKGSLVLEHQERVYDDRYKTVEVKKKKTELGEAFQAMLDFGIDILQLLADQLRSGDYELMPLFEELMGLHRPAGWATHPERAKADLAYWESSKHDLWIPPVSAAKLKERKP